MADLTRVSAPNFDGSNPALPKYSGARAGEAIAKGDWCYMHTDGRWRKATGAADNAAAKALGMAMTTVSADQPLTVSGPGWRWKYGSGLTPGARYFLGTNGLLADAATTGGTTVLAFAMSATDIVQVGRED